MFKTKDCGTGYEYEVKRRVMFRSFSSTAVLGALSTLVPDYGVVPD